jgi:3',5'-cyclic AMP phosphodiesterase CpdA
VGTFLVVGDLQRTSLLEVWRESNLAERRALIEAIAREDADFLVLLGDLVFRGDSSSDWDDFDRLTAPLAHLTKYPVLGNHDYGLRAATALKKFRARFPGFVPYYVQTYGSLRLIFLDSNRSRMAAWAEQEAWFRDQLLNADGDARVSAVIVFVHHPPFTNSRVSGDDRDVRTTLVPPFMNAKKSRAMISGHVHSYERFERNGKVFIVSGGGGGPRASLHAGARRRHHDDLYGGAHLRPFHYLRVTPRENELLVEARGLEKGGGLIVEIDRFAIGTAR